jgi:hypothetical protein
VPMFYIRPPEYVTGELVAFIENRLMKKPLCA